MDRQIKSFAFLLLLLLATVLQSSVATIHKVNTRDERQRDNETKDRDPQKSSASEPKPAPFPHQLDLRTLKNMPVVILHPRTPITFQMMPGENFATLHKSLNPEKILEILQAATFNVPAKLLPPNKGQNRQARNRNFGNPHPQASVNRPLSVHSSSPALPRSLINPQNNGWFQKFRGSFSNMFPVIKPFPLELPTMNLPVFIPHQNSMQSINPFMLGSQQQFHILPWRNFHLPSVLPMGDLTTEASFLHPTRMFFGNSHLNHFRPAPIPHQQFGGDLATSGSAFVPRRIPPIGHHHFPRFTSPLQRHKPLFSNVGGLHAASMDISNAFADFTDSKEHGPEVTQRFGSVGHSITNFLKMMGLGAGGGLSFDDVGGFGGGSDMASMDSTPIARSMDFYPGYGNQAHLDDIGDFPEFHEDITHEFMSKMNLTNSTSIEEKEKKKEMPKKEAILPPKISLELNENSKILLNKGAKINKQIAKEGLEVSYAPAVPLDKVNYGKVSADKAKSEPIGPKMFPEGPVVKYNVPPTHSTVAPHDRRQPVAIYQNFSPINKEPPKTTYAPAQEMSRPETEDNPNKLVNEDEVRQWRLVNNGMGYVEKRPVPIVDVLQSSMHPESFKILQKVLSGGVHMNISKST